MKKYLHTTHKNVLWFVRANERGEIKINPPFQRNPVWTTQQKSFLIDTILHEFPIPELYMQEIVKDTGTSENVIVDGQQRIRAIIEYVNNEYSLNAKDSPDWADLSFDELTPQEKKKIYEYEFVVRVLPDMTQAEIREIFTRLNRNTVALNSQELRQATYWGDFIKTINEIITFDEWQELNIFTANDLRRMLDAEYVSELVIADLHGLQNKKQTIDKFYQIYEQEFEERPKVMKTFRKVLGEIVSILDGNRKSRWSKKTDFYTLFVEFAQNSDSLPLTKDSRKIAHDRLLEFAEKVDDFTKTTDDKDLDKIPENVSKYGQAIRAGTDLGNRRRRQEVLSELLNDIWK
tara:strand:+ start:4942 stop:5982 length:1041 start_codon:yes stop_codon:yes gene_type:complete